MQAAVHIRQAHASAILCIIMDAADNAQMAATEFEGTRSFASDLIREVIPDGIRLVFLTRTHRQELLMPPSNAVRIKLLPFSREETERHLKQAFNDATNADVDEFHHLTSQNPRVQALALSQGQPLRQTLRSLGPNPTTVEDTISELLKRSLDRLRDVASQIEKLQINSICTSLAALRPMIPLAVLSEVSGSEVAAIRSFANDLGRPLLIVGDTVQFCDEPTETWFREKFVPNAQRYSALVASLQPLASSSPYVAATLPQMMLEAGLFDELVELALSSSALPLANPIQKRDVELQRLQFALKATLRKGLYADAAKLALKAGGESAGDERQADLLQQNTDLVSIFLDDNATQELVQRRIFKGSGWIGSHHAYEAGLLSGRPALQGGARSRLRMTGEWLRSFFQQPANEREHIGIGVQDDDILEIATTHLNLHGPEACARELRRWTPRTISFRVGLKLAIRLTEQGRLDLLADLALAARNDFHLSLAICTAMRATLQMPPTQSIERTFRLLERLLPSLEYEQFIDRQAPVLQAVSALVEAARLSDIVTPTRLAALLEHYLPKEPPWDIGSRSNSHRVYQMKAYCLHAALSGTALKIEDLAHSNLKKELNSPATLSESREAQDFSLNIGILLPWIQIWADTIAHRLPLENLSQRIDNAKASSERILNRGYFGQNTEAVSDVSVRRPPSPDHRAAII